jgi:hypothetical protein
MIAHLLQLLFSGQYALERLYRNAGIHAGIYIRIRIRPGLGSGQGIKFGNDQGSGKARRARVVTVDRRVRPCQLQASLVTEGFQSRQVRGASLFA